MKYRIMWHLIWAFTFCQSLRLVIVFMESHVYNVRIDCIYIFLKIVSVLANSVDPDEMPHFAAFHLGRHFFANVRVYELEGVTSI